MKPKLALLIADDLTGACDAAVHFATRGARTVVSLTGECADADVVAVSTESRDAPGHEMVSRIQALASYGAPAAFNVVFKKIDSVLRGKPGLEIAAALSAFRCEAAVVTPAFPALGRRVRGGYLHVDGVPEPVHVATKLRADGIGAAEFRCVFADAESEADLDLLVGYGMALKGPVLWVGSGGLAAALADRLCGSPGMPALPPLRPGPVVFCLGSTHAATVAQQRELLECRPAVLLEADHATALARDSHSLLRIARGATPAARVAELLAPIRPAALFCCGGDTAALVLAAIGAREIALRGEIVPGLPWGEIVGGSMNGVPIATKSGGFGAPDALIRTADWFTGQP